MSQHAEFVTSGEREVGERSVEDRSGLMMRPVAKFILYVSVVNE
jgi:hypothetical protein